MTSRFALVRHRTHRSGLSDKFWGGRWLAKSFIDQEGAVDSADIGVHALGKHADGMFKWGAAIVNGEGYGNPDMDNDKTFQARATVDPLNGDIKLPISVYVSQEFYTPEDVDGQNIIIASSDSIKSSSRSGVST